MGHIIAKTYEILGELGSGGGGTVYLAQHLRLGKKVVLKADKRKLKTPAADLRREVDILKGLHNPYIPQVYDFLAEGDTVYTVMDYIEGESFDKLLKRGAHFTQPQLVQWTIQLLQALAYLHARPPHGILHGDIKPANIMLTPEGDIRLIDFNIALNLGEEGAVAVGRSFGYASPEHYGLDYSEKSSTHTGATTRLVGTQTQLGNETVLGTPNSSSGNTQSKQAILLSPRSDIYSLGATLYHLMTGCKPAKDALDVVPISSRAYNPAFIAIIQKAMQPDQTRRYQTAEEMLRAVRDLWDKDTRIVRLQRTRRVLAGVLGAAFIVGAASAFVGFTRMQKIQSAKDAAALSAQQLAAGELEASIQTAAAAIPEKSGVLTPPVQPCVQKALTDALGLYDLSGGLRLSHTITLSSEALKLALSPDKKTGAALSLGSTVLFSTETGQTLACLTMVDSAQADFAFLDDDTFVYAGSGGLSIYRISAGEIVWTGEACEKIAVSANGASIAAASMTQQHAVVYTPDGKVRRQIDFAGRNMQTVSNGRFADPKDMLFALNAAGDLLAISFSDGSLTLYDIVAQEDIGLLDESEYLRFEGGFSGNYFAFSASNQASSLFAVVDTQTMEQTGGFELTSKIGVQADESGIYICNEYTLVQIDPLTGEQREMAFTNSIITDFWRSAEHTLVMTQDAGVFLFDKNAIEEPYEVLHRRENNYAILWDGGIALASLDSPVVQLLHFTDGSGECVFRYDAGYTHDEARVNQAQTAAMLFSYSGFRLIDRDGNILRETALPNAGQIYDQQYYKDEQGSRLEVIYEDGHIDIYSGDTGEKLGTRQVPAPDDSLAETFFTDQYRIESPLHGTPVVYDRKSGREIGKLERDAYLTYVTQMGAYIVTEYISEDGSRWGLLLNEALEPLATLPQLCDILEDGLLFDDQLGNLRRCRVYSIEEIKNLANQVLEESQR